MNLQGKIFYIIRDKLPGVDEKWFIETFMKSFYRSRLDEGIWIYAYKSPEAAVEWFMCEIGPGDIWSGEFISAEYKKGEEWGGFLPQWAGMMYSYYQWRTGIPSAELIEQLTLEDMERIYPALHQMGWEAGANKIHEEVLRIGRLAAK
jgi:hypothetical protein